MAGFANNVMNAENVRFDGGSYPGQVTADGQLLIGSTVAPNIRVATLTPGTNIGITNGAGSITLNTTGVASFSWSNVNASAALVVNRGINCTAGADLSFSLPAVSAVGDVIRVVLDGSTSWTITQAANQQIRMGSSQTTLGVAGTLASTAQGDAIEMVCKTANLVWTVVSSMGNIAIV